MLVGAGAPPSAPSLVQTLADDARKAASRSPAAQKAQSLARQVEAAAGDKARQEAAVDKVMQRYQDAIYSGDLPAAEKEQAALDVARRRLLVLIQRLDHLTAEKTAADKAVKDAEETALDESRRRAHQKADALRQEALDAISKAAGPALEKLLEADRVFLELRNIQGREQWERAERARQSEKAPATA
jgi:hypothetical protein